MKTNVRYMGFGFPVFLLGVDTVQTDGGSSYLDIPHHKLAKSLFLAVLLKPTFLTGAELKFIRKYLDLTQEEFAKVIGAKGHSNIAGWENKGQRSTGMVEQAEMIARLKLAMEFSEGAIKIDDFYATIVKSGLAKDSKIIELNMQNVA